MTTPTILFALIGAAMVASSWGPLRQRLALSRAKHRSLAGHARLSRVFSKLLPFYDYDEAHFFTADGAPDHVGQQRREGFFRLAAIYSQRFAKTARATSDVQSELADLQFISRYRVPFQFSRIVRQNFSAGSFLQSSSGTTTTDLDGNQFYDLTGSYGVNVFGYDFYKDCIARGSERVADLGPVLGAYHPVTAFNVHRLREISGLDEVSFHMSGTEAVMQAVRLARYHTGRRHLVRFCGAYHGWWGDVQPGVGNPLPARDTYTLKDMSDASLRVLRMRQDIACVLINPIQALHPNVNAPADNMLLDSGRSAHFDRATYAQWLQRLRAVCTERNIVLIVDDVFLGFRLARGGSQEYFGIKADMVTYGKTVAGGLPIGVVCGKRELMRRYREDRPADICFARGTFNAHPYVMGAMYEFLTRLDSTELSARYHNLDEVWNARAHQLNERLRAAGLNVQVANLSSVWTVFYPQPSRYNWMLQYYLRAEGLALSWVGTGRLIFSLNYSDADFAQVVERFVAAATLMEREGWWWRSDELSNKAIRRRVLRETLRARGNASSGQSVHPEASTAALGNKA